MKKVIVILVPPGLDSAVQGHPEDRISCGNGASSRPDNGDKFIKTMGYIQVPNEIPISFYRIGQKMFKL